MPQENGRVTRDCVQINVKRGHTPCWVVRPKSVSGFSLGWCANSLCFGGANGDVNTSIWSHKNVDRSNNCRICTVSSFEEASSDGHQCCWIVADRDIAAGEEILVLYGRMYSDECRRNGYVDRCLSLYESNLLKIKAKPQSAGRPDIVRRPRGRAGRPSKISQLRGRAKQLKMQSLKMTGKRRQ